MQFTLKHVQKQVPDIELQVQKLDISKTHLYKINSVLLNKCFTTLFGENLFSRLEFLRMHGMIVLLRSEIKTAETAIVPELNDTEKENFYLQTFRLFIDLPYKFFDKKLVEQYGKKYLVHKKNKTKSDTLYIEQHIIFADCNRCAALKNPQNTFGYTEEQLLKRQKELEAQRHYLALYYSYRTMISFYSFYTKKPELIKTYLEKCIQLKDKIQPYFQINIGQFLNLLLAESSFVQHKFDEAYDLYTEEFSKGIPDNMYGYHSHCEEYTLLCLILKEFDRAKIILDDVFAPLIDLKADILATRGCLSYAKLFLLRNDSKNAMYYIRIGMEINEKGTYLPFELQLRLLETLCFLKKGDYTFGVKLSARHLKFVLAQKEKKLLADYENLFRLLHSYCKRKEKYAEPNEADTNQIHELNNRYKTIYCGLLAL